MPVELIKEAITAHYGERCQGTGADCPCCQVWAEFDALVAPETPALERYVQLYDCLNDEIYTEVRENGEWVRHDQASRIIADAHSGNRYAQLERIAVKRAETAEAKVKERGVEITGLRNSYWQERKARLEAEAALKAAQERETVLRDVLETVANAHANNPSDAMADMPEADYVRHILWELRKIARAALATGEQ